MCNNQSFIQTCGKHVSEIVCQLKFTSRQTNDNKYVTYVTNSVLLNTACFISVRLYFRD
jgi:hypothetical protein